MEVRVVSQTLWNFEPTYGSDCLGVVRLEYLRPMHWQVWDERVEQPGYWECVVDGDLDELNWWAVGMHNDGRLDVLESLSLAMTQCPVAQFLQIRPRARLVALGRSRVVAQQQVAESGDEPQCVHVFAEPARGRSVAVWSLKRAEHDEEIGDCDVLCSGANSVEDVVEAALRIGSDITDLYSARIEQMFEEISLEQAAILRAIAC